MSKIDLVTFRGDEVSPHWLSAQAIRWEVFVQEQKVPAIVEIDSRDFLSTTTHLVLLRADRAVATARILPDPDRHFHLGRVAVLRSERGLGLGREVMQAAISIVTDLIPQGQVGVIALDAQVQAQGFYASCGFSPTDRETFLDAGILHQEMAMQISGTASSLR